MSQRLGVYPDPASLAGGAASVFVGSFKSAVAERGIFTAVLSGGSTPLALYRLLAAEHKDLDWAKAHLFWGDERCGSPGDAGSNYNGANAALISKIEIPPENIHRIKGELAPDEAARLYEKELTGFFGVEESTPPPFDLVLLGMGADGHTLSLFPGTRALDEKERLVVPNFAGKLDAWRVTLTFRAIERAKKTVFLVAGAGKAAVLKEVLEGKDYPAGRVKGQEVVWLADKDAAFLIKE